MALQTQAEFIAALRAALHGAPVRMIDEITADIAAHFAEGRAHGRNDAAIAEALGDPVALAHDVRIGASIETWERDGSVGAAARLLKQLLGLGALNALAAFVLAPLATIVAFIVAATAVAFIVAGLWLLMAGTSLGLPGGLLASLLASAGMLAAAVALAALLGLATIGLARLASRHARAHVRAFPNVAEANT